MNVWRKQTVKFSRHGKRVVILSKRFYGTLRTANGKRKQIPLTLQKETSRTLLRRLQTEADTKWASGVDRYAEERERPVVEHLDDYVDYLAAKENTLSYVTTARQLIVKLIDETKAKTLADLDTGRILRTLATWRQRKHRPLGIGGSNHYIRSIKGFSRWLWRERRTPDDPLVGLRRMNAEADRRHVRRPLTVEELKRLTDVTQQSKTTYRGRDWLFTPDDRAILYSIAAYSGLRAKEIASLTKDDFDFETETLIVAASNTKNRKTAKLPLHPTLSEKLKTWFATLDREPLFPGSWCVPGKSRAGETLKRDLKRAGIAYRDAGGRVVDFHALRYTFITSLAKAGVHPAKAQRLARHSTIALTMNVYTQLDVEDLRDAVASLYAS